MQEVRVELQNKEPKDTKDTKDAKEAKEVNFIVFEYNGKKITQEQPAVEDPLKIDETLIEKPFWRVGKDWETNPFTSLLVTDETYCPKSHPELAFYRPWYGT